MQQVVTLQPVRPRGKVTVPQRVELQSMLATEILAGKSLCTTSVNSTTWVRLSESCSPFRQLENNGAGGPSLHGTWEVLAHSGISQPDGKP